MFSLDYYDPLRESVRDKKMEIFFLSFLVWMLSDQVFKVPHSKHSILTSSQIHFCILGGLDEYIGMLQVTSLVPRPINMFLLRFLIGFWHVELFYLINTNIISTNQTQHVGKLPLRPRRGETHGFLLIQVLRGDIQKSDDKCITIVYKCSPLHSL